MAVRSEVEGAARPLQGACRLSGLVVMIEPRERRWERGRCKTTGVIIICQKVGGWSGLGIVGAVVRRAVERVNRRPRN